MSDRKDSPRCSGKRGGGMDAVLRRLGAVEAAVEEIRKYVASGACRCRSGSGPQADASHADAAPSGFEPSDQKTLAMAARELLESSSFIIDCPVSVEFTGETADFIEAEFRFMRNDFGECSTSSVCEGFSCKIWKNDKARTVREFDALVAGMAAFSFSAVRKDRPCEVTKKKGASRKEDSGVKPPPTEAGVLLCALSDRELARFLAGASSYDIPESRIRVLSRKVDRRHGSVVCEVGLFPKSVKSYRKGEERRPETVRFLARLSPELAPRAAARFDKAVSGLKTVRFGKRSR